MIGLRAGTRMIYTDCDGVGQDVSVNEVVQQPEAQARAKVTHTVDFPESRLQRCRKRDAAGNGGAADEAVADKAETAGGDLVRFRPKPRSPAVDPDDDPGPRAA